MSEAEQAKQRETALIAMSMGRRGSGATAPLDRDVPTVSVPTIDPHREWRGLVDAETSRRATLGKRYNVTVTDSGGAWERESLGPWDATAWITDDMSETVPQYVGGSIGFHGTGGRPRELVTPTVSVNLASIHGIGTEPAWDEIPCRVTHVTHALPTVRVGRPYHGPSLVTVLDSTIPATVDREQHRRTPRMGKGYPLPMLRSVVSGSIRGDVTLTHLRIGARSAPMRTRATLSTEWKRANLRNLPRFHYGTPPTYGPRIGTDARVRWSTTRVYGAGDWSAIVPRTVGWSFTDGQAPSPTVGAWEPMPSPRILTVRGEVPRSTGRPRITNPSPAALKKREQRANKR